MLDEQLNNILKVEFKYSYGCYYFKNAFFDINYNYLNNMISIFIGNEIYQINSITKEIVTIYDTMKKIENLNK